VNPEARVPRPRLIDAGLFLVVVAVPLAVFPLAVQPFSDLKLPLLLIGAALLWGSGLPPARRVRRPALAFAGAAVLATIFGSGPADAVLGTWEATGLLLLLACAALVALGPSLRAEHASRARGLYAGAAIAVAVVPLAWSVARPALEGVRVDLQLNGSTIGNPVLLAIFLAAAIPAIVVSDSVRVRLGAAAALGAALAMDGERSALMLPVVAVALCAWGLPRLRRRVAVFAAVLLLSGVAWSLARPTASGIASTEAQFSTSVGERQRVAELSANATAFLRRPVFGWGPGLAWNGFASSATTEQMRVATRGWRDAHDLPLQVLETTGVLGGAAFLALAGLLVAGAVRGSAERRWLVLAAAVLALGSLYEPTTVSLTPLLFLFAGAAAPEPVPPTPERPRARAVRGVVVVALSVGALVASMALTASALEEWGRTHYAEWSIRSSIAVQPWRLGARELLAIQLAIDGRGGGERAAAEARSTILAAVRAHPWDPNVRLVASDVERLLKDFDAARAWIERQHERFPNDPLPGSSRPGAPIVAGSPSDT
jgi:O-antigen ligase